MSKNDNYKIDRNDIHYGANPVSNRVIALRTNGGGAPPNGPDDRMLDRIILIHNEKTKHVATTTNNTAIALFGGGALIPVISLSFPLSSAPPFGQVTTITIFVWAFVAAILHWWSRSMLDGLR